MGLPASWKVGEGEQCPAFRHVQHCAGCVMLYRPLLVKMHLSIGPMDHTIYQVDSARDIGLDIVVSCHVGMHASLVSAMFAQCPRTKCSYMSIAVFTNARFTSAIPKGGFSTKCRLVGTSRRFAIAILTLEKIRESRRGKRTRKLQATEQAMELTAMNRS